MYYFSLAVFNLYFFRVQITTLLLTSEDRNPCSWLSLCWWRAKRDLHFFPVVFDLNRVNIVKMFLSCWTIIVVLLVNNSMLLLRPFCLSHFCLQIVDFSRAQSIYIGSKNKTQGTHLHVMTQIVRSLNSLHSFLHYSAPLNVDLCIISRVYSCT